MASNSEYNILLVEGDQAFARSLCSSFNEYPRLTCHKYVCDKAELNEAISRAHCDLLLVNVDQIDWLKDAVDLKIHFLCFYRKSDFQKSFQHLNREDLSDFILRLQDKLQVNSASPAILNPGCEQIFPLWTATGLELLKVSDVVSFQRDFDLRILKPNWFVKLKSGEAKPLKRASKARDILAYFSGRLFIQVNQSTLLNLMYVESIDYEQRSCKLKAPFEPQIVSLSRRYLTSIKKRFDFY